jgi:hypothetical protein
MDRDFSIVDKQSTYFSAGIWLPSLSISQNTVAKVFEERNGIRTGNVEQIM